MRVIGLMSGTSVDGIDAALVEIDQPLGALRIQFLAGHTYPYPPEVRQRILAVCAGEPQSMQQLSELDDAIAQAFAASAIALQQGQPAAEAIGSHGQTVFHRPPHKDGLGYSLQLGRGAVIAQLTGLPTVNDFRAADIALGGQGAPLVPAIDNALLRHPTQHRCVQNIGGIGNVTYLPPRPSSHTVLGWDTGPGNVLLDLAVTQLSQGRLTYDQDGAWAATGTPNRELVEQWLTHEFFQQPPPKSTGRELFGPAFLADCCAAMADLGPADQLATLTDFTAASIVASYHKFLPQFPDQVYLCGGGSKNPTLRQYLHQRLRAIAPGVEVSTTSALGLDADFKEAIAFAVLAYWRLHDQPGNLPEVTGARHLTLLGEIHQAA